MPPEGNEKIIGYLAGPTACGKSTLGAALAAKMGWAIISADSMQVYRGLAVGTGVIPEDERLGVPHHLLSFVDPREEYHAARFVKDAKAAALSEWELHQRPSLVVGGTGLWIEALREGLFNGPGRDEALREKMRDEMRRTGTATLHAQLALVDPSSAQRIAPTDSVRIIRALEVFQLSGRPLSDWYAEDEARRLALGTLPPLVVIDRPREELDRRIDLRVEQMLKSGWLNEARDLLTLNLPDSAPAGKALGYPELFKTLRGEKSLAEATTAIQLATRQFSRGQRTWFKARRQVKTLMIEPGKKLPLAELEKCFSGN